MNDSEGTQGMAQSTEEIANAGGASLGLASTDQQPLPGAQMGQQDPATQAALDSDAGTGDGPRAQLLEDQELQTIRGQWKDIQAEFVDEPRKAVQEADALVAELMQRLAQEFASEREELESRWSGGDDVSTEDLRRGLRRYRSFFERLLAA